MGGVDYHHFGALFSTDDNFVGNESDEYTTFYPRSLICCRIVAITVSSLLCMYRASYIELVNRARRTIFTFNSSPVHAVCASSDVAYNAVNNLWCCWR